MYIKWSTGQDSMFYVCTDRQGSITALLKQTGAVSERYSYDAYGRRRNPANWADYNVKAPRLIARGYTGHEHLDGFGLINMNGRMYDPVIGRVLSPDKIVQAPGYTQSYNRYSYCMNNPLRYTDPSGYTYYECTWGRDINQVADRNSITFYSYGVGSPGNYFSGKGGGDGSSNGTYYASGGGGPQLTLVQGPDGKSAWVNNSDLKIYRPVYGTAWAGGDISNLGYKGWGIIGWEQVKSGIAKPSGDITVPYILGGMENTTQALIHYFDGTGIPVMLGNNSVEALINSKEFQYRHNRIITGQTPKLIGDFPVDLTWTVYHIGETNVNYSISVSNETCTVTYELFTNDGFWDVDKLDEITLGKILNSFKPDRQGPNLERFGGTPYPYIPIKVSYTFPNPGYK